MGRTYVSHSIEMMDGRMPTEKRQGHREQALKAIRTEARFQGGRAQSSPQARRSWQSSCPLWLLGGTDTRQPGSVPRAACSAQPHLAGGSSAAAPQRTSARSTTASTASWFLQRFCEDRRQTPRVATGTGANACSWRQVGCPRPKHLLHAAGSPTEQASPGRRPVQRTRRAAAHRGAQVGEHAGEHADGEQHDQHQEWEDGVAPHQLVAPAGPQRGPIQVVGACRWGRASEWGRGTQACCNGMPCRRCCSRGPVRPLPPRALEGLG